MLHVTDVAFLLISFCTLRFRDFLNMSITAPLAVMIAGKIKSIVIPVFWWCCLRSYGNRLYKYVQDFYSYLVYNIKQIEVD